MRDDFDEDDFEDDANIDDNARGSDSLVVGRFTAVAGAAVAGAAGRSTLVMIRTLSMFDSLKKVAGDEVVGEKDF